MNTSTQHDIRKFPAALEADKAFTRKLNSYSTTKGGAWLGEGRVSKDFIAYKNPFYLGFVIVAYKNKVVGYFADTRTQCIYSAIDAAAALVDGSFRDLDKGFEASRKEEASKGSGVAGYAQLLADEFGLSVH